MAYLNAVTLFALCRGLVHGFRGKSLLILWPFFMENNRMIVIDALNAFQGWVVAGLIISLYFQTHEICCFRFLPQAGRPVRYARNSTNWIRASVAGLDFYNRTLFNVALHDSFAANRDKCNPELSL